MYYLFKTDHLQNKTFKKLNYFNKFKLYVMNNIEVWLHIEQRV